MNVHIPIFRKCWSLILGRFSLWVSLRRFLKIFFFYFLKPFSGLFKRVSKNSPHVLLICYCFFIKFEDHINISHEKCKYYIVSCFEASDGWTKWNNYNLWEQLSAYVSEYPVLFDKSNKRNDKHFNNRHYSLFFLMGVFLKHLWLIPNILKWQDYKIFTKLVPSQTRPRKSHRCSLRKVFSKIS